MVMEAANTTVTVLRGTSTSPYGDVEDLNEPVFAGIPAVLTETSRQTQDPSDPTPRTIRAIECHVPEFVALQTTDRVVDEATQDVFIVIQVTKPPTLMGAPVDTLVLLKRVTATTT